MAYIIEYSISLSIVLITCILNWFKGHCLLSDVLNVTISMGLKLKEEINHLLLLDALIIT
jgi:hypothetical protein